MWEPARKFAMTAHWANGMTELARHIQHPALIVLRARKELLRRLHALRVLLANFPPLAHQIVLIVLQVSGLLRGLVPVPTAPQAATDLPDRLDVLLVILDIMHHLVMQIVNVFHVLMDIIIQIMERTNVDVVQMVNGIMS